MANTVRNRIIVLATFVGSSGKASLGYQRHKKYTLTMEIYSNGRVIILPEKVDQNAPKPCEYGSIIAFFNNWIDISRAATW